MIIQKALLKKSEVLWKSLVESGGKIDILKPLTMIFPSRFLDIGAATIGEVIEVTGIVLILDEQYNYITFNVLNKIRFIPNTVDSIKIDGIDYMKMDFTPENGFITSRDVIMDNDIVFLMFEELYFKGKIPFYVTYTDLPNLFLKSAITTTAPLGNNPVAHLLFTAVIARSHDGTTQKRYLNNGANFRWIPLGNPDMSSDNNVSRLLGSYQTRGLTAALADDEPLETEFDDILTL